MLKILKHGIYLILIIFFFSACENQVKNEDSITLSQDEQSAIDLLKSNFNENQKMTSYEVVTGKYPLIASKEYQNLYENLILSSLYSNKDSKKATAELYNSIGILTEGLKKKIEDSNDEYVTVMAEIQTEKDSLKKTNKCIVIFKTPVNNTPSYDAEKIIKVSNDYLGLAAMVAMSEANMSLEDFKDKDENFIKNFIENVKDPVLRFMLEPIDEE